MLKLDGGRFRTIRPQQPTQTPVQDVSVQTVEIPTVQIKAKPDPKTYMVLFTRKVDGVTIQTVADKKTGNVFVIQKEIYNHNK
jgi:hypothetical protein